MGAIYSCDSHALHIKMRSASFDRGEVLLMLKLKFFLIPLACLFAFILQSSYSIGQAAIYGDGVRRLELTRGTWGVPDNETKILQSALVCDYLRSRILSPNCYGVDAVILKPLSGIADLVVSSAKSSGFVEFGDWDSQTAPKLIVQIEASLRRQVKKACFAIGKNCAFSEWIVHPKLLKNKQYFVLSYNFKMADQLINKAQVIVYDRKGYVAFDAGVDSSFEASEEQPVFDLLIEIADRYKQADDYRYADFNYRDKAFFIQFTEMLTEHFDLTRKTPMDSVEEGYAIAGYVAIGLLTLIILLVFLQGVVSSDARPKEKCGKES
ncbi:hypothetical protein PsAD46_03672 [Pseudovibrio sp. Ad46]|nr:hypothetical protein PsAD46_03672 [Pseudovibrio sp. Ad46]